MNILEPIEEYKKKYNLNFDGFISKEIGCHLTFELGDNLPNGSLERVNQAKNRALEIFKFFIPENSICVFEIYKYHGIDFYDQENKFQNYLEEIIDLKNKEIYEGPFSKIIISNDDQNINISMIDEILECDIIIGKERVTNEKIKKIIEGIVNLEQGFEPIISQNIYIYSLRENIGFRIYDDRGCHIWSDDVAKMKSVYTKYKDWIVENEKEMSKIIYN